MVINGIEWSEYDIMMVEKFIDIKNKGYYADGKQVTEYYNKLLNKHVTPTNCGSCIRQRVGELENALNHAKELEKQRAELEMKERMAKVREAKKKKEE